MVSNGHGDMPYGTKIVAELKNQFSIFLPRTIMNIFGDGNYEDMFEKIKEASKTKMLYFRYFEQSIIILNLYIRNNRHFLYECCE